MDERRHALHLVIDGRVQGVGYRPFVYRRALHHGLTGWVRNRTGRVEVLAGGASSALEAFAADLIDAAPPLARPRLVAKETAEPPAEPGFRIEASEAAGPAGIHVPPDQFACDDCLAEMADPSARRYRYPFINCTQCGPRYTLIERLPYDRPHTAMAGFPLCPACRAEYEDPVDRRFHAQPLACPECGPNLSWSEDGSTGEAALAAAVSALRGGAVVAVKGIGGYHLLCDAADAAAVARLRDRKKRPDKPLAVMFADLAAVNHELAPTDLEAERLAAPERPIVLVDRRADSRLAEGTAPGLGEVGAMLAYSPLHHLLLGDFGGPLVATSGNVSGEPVLTDPEEAEQRLAAVADGFLHHDRPILRPADDPVQRVVAGAPRPLRLGRGDAPLELDLPFRLDLPTLAVGGHMKNTVALAWNDRAVVSPHIGDLDAPRARRVFDRVAADLQRLYGVAAERVVADLHPDYASSRWARDCGLPVSRVQHHRAHASALYAEHAGRGDWLVFTWDGVGLGDDGGLWGGEAFAGRPGQWRRVAALRPFRLPGGEKAAREPWRAALGLCWENGEEWNGAPEGADLLRQAWDRDHQCPATSAAGRLFDGAAALLGLVRNASFEGQGPMLVEAAAGGQADGPDLPVETGADGLARWDWAPLLDVLRDGTRPVAERAMAFHHALARAILTSARRRREGEAIRDVGLTGGVFQNRLLTETARDLLEADGFTVHLATRVPCNDGGLAFGQLAEAMWP